MAKKEPLYPHITPSQRKRQQEEMEEQKSWVDLTEQEKLAYATRLVDSGLTGWENMKQVADEMGIYPDEDQIPTLYELEIMVKEHRADVAKGFRDFEVDVHYSGYITVSVEASNSNEAVLAAEQKAERYREAREGKFIEEFMPTLEAWPEADTVRD